MKTKEIKLTKPRAKTEIIFKEDKDDPWFIWMHRVEKKSGKKTSSMILEKDVPDFMRPFLEKGWVVFDPNTPVEVKEAKSRKPKIVKKRLNNPPI